MRNLPWLFLVLLLLSTPAAAERLRGKVNWVYDGDTLKVAGVGKVRLLGIDSAEKEDSARDDYYLRRYNLSRSSLRKQAHDALRFNIQRARNRQVTLEFDRQRLDKYGRTLAYLYLPDGTMLNRLLIEEGLAFVYRRFDFREKRSFLAAEKKARKQRNGIWSESRR